MIHHLALAVKNVRKSHYFYTEVMGFVLVKAVKRKSPDGGWTKHIFYDMGSGKLFAIWDLRGLEGASIEANAWRSGVSTGLGLPSWVNHIAFECEGAEELEAHKQAWLAHGYHVSEVDHDFIRSIYTLDPDGNMVEWTYKTRALDHSDREEAERILADDSPATESDYEARFFRSTVAKIDPTASRS
jgi:catechol 2,3-dioxygenase-like lactoylglutathione lyase family enzyme